RGTSVDPAKRSSAPSGVVPCRTSSTRVVGIPPLSMRTPSRSLPLLDPSVGLHQDGGRHPEEQAGRRDAGNRADGEIEPGRIGERAETAIEDPVAVVGRLGGRSLHAYHGSETEPREAIPAERQGEGQDLHREAAPTAERRDELLATDEHDEPAGGGGDDLLPQGRAARPPCEGALRGDLVPAPHGEIGGGGGGERGPPGPAPARGAALGPPGRRAHPP